MPEENPTPKPVDPAYQMTVEQRLAAIEATLEEIRALLQKDVGTSRLGHT